MYQHIPPNINHVNKHSIVEKRQLMMGSSHLFSGQRGHAVTAQKNRMNQSHNDENFKIL